MATGFATTSSWTATLGQFRWLRAHISTFCLGAVVFVCVNLLLSGSSRWSLTAIGIWIMLLVVHGVVLAIARLSTLLLADDDEEVVLLPIKDALIVEPKPNPASTWVTAGEPTPATDEAASPDEKIPWTVATDVAQVRRPLSGDPPV